GAVIESAVQLTRISSAEPGSRPLVACRDSEALPLRREIAGRPFAGRLLPVADRRLPVAGRPNASFRETRTYRTALTPQAVVQADAHSSKGPPVDMCDPP